MRNAAKYAWDKLPDKDAYCQHIVRQLADATEGKLKAPDGSINPFPALILEQVPWRVVTPWWDAEAGKDFFRTVLLGSLPEEESVAEKQMTAECERLVRSFIVAVAVSVDDSLKEKVPKSHQLDEVPQVDGWTKTARKKGKKKGDLGEPSTPGAGKKEVAKTSPTPSPSSPTTSSSSSPVGSETAPSPKVEDEGKPRTSTLPAAAESTDAHGKEELDEGPVVDRTARSARRDKSLSKQERCHLLALALIDQYGMDFRFPHDDDVEMLETVRGTFNRYLSRGGCSDGPVSTSEVVSLLKHIIRQGTRLAWDAMENWQAFCRYLIRGVHSAVKDALRDRRTGKLVAKPVSVGEIPWKAIAPCWNPKGMRGVFTGTIMPLLGEDVDGMPLDALVKRLWAAWELPRRDNGEEAKAYTDCEKAVKDYLLSLASKADPTVKVVCQERISSQLPLYG
ncbi:hypothetical protein FOZ63_028666 [Perkinsus olseni]|uniref:Uncharacterized protein n=1 Tax=Perkinsus olseni TaxID=32597 RepID=A0A7J6PWR7_PEROL|nr:hypothetical protein FOZ63_028666 [Perkinsus olseni]